jgi:hypothetical protein
MRRSRAPFMVVVSTVGWMGCSGASHSEVKPLEAITPAGNPPMAPEPIPIPPTSNPPPELERIDLGQYKETLNARHAEHGTIYRRGSGEGCEVHLPLEGRAPPGMVNTQDMDCPPEMDDVAWADCAGGMIHTNGEDCVCSVMGNPPMPPRRVSCPLDEL